MTIKEINQTIGNIDIYLLDQILKGRYESTMKVLDAGCGEGRNIMYFMGAGFNVYGVDHNSDAIRMLKFVVGSTFPNVPKNNFQESSVESMGFDIESFDLIISSAVLHFAENTEHFKSMFKEMVRVLKPGGHLFIRMTSDIGIDLSGCEKKGDLYLLRDGTLRFLITRNLIEEMKSTHNLQLTEPLKSTNVSDQRSMATIVLKKLK